MSHGGEQGCGAGRLWGGGAVGLWRGLGHEAVKSWGLPLRPPPPPPHPMQELIYAGQRMTDDGATLASYHVPPGEAVPMPQAGCAIPTLSACTPSHHCPGG